MLLTPALYLVQAKRELKKRNIWSCVKTKMTTTNTAKTAFNSNWLETKGMAWKMISQFILGGVNVKEMKSTLMFKWGFFTSFKAIKMSCVVWVKHDLKISTNFQKQKWSFFFSLFNVVRINLSSLELDVTHLSRWWEQSLWQPAASLLLGSSQASTLHVQTLASCIQLLLRHDWERWACRPSSSLLFNAGNKMENAD